MKHLKRLLGILLAICLLLGTVAAVSVEDVQPLPQETASASASNGFVVKLREDGTRAQLQANDAL